MQAQVKVQTVPGFANGLIDGMPKFIQQEGVAGCACMELTPCMYTRMMPTRLPQASGSKQAKSRVPAEEAG
jgi:hypothetical protein